MSASNPAPPPASRPREQRLGLFLVLLGIYLLTMSRERPWSDGELMFQVAEAMVERSGVEIQWATPPYSYRGPDGGIYAYFPLLPSLVLTPSLWLLGLLGPRWYLFGLPLATQFPAALLTALAGVFFHALSRRTGAGPRAAVISTLIFGLSTSVWVYARRPYSEALQLAVFCGFILALLRAGERGGRRDALLVGVVAGLALNTELALGLGVLAGLGFVSWERLKARRPLVPFLAWVGCGALPLICMFLAYDIGRWGAPLTTGYEQIWAMPGESPFWGAFALAFSPGKSIFLYSPPLTIAAAAGPALWRAERRLVLVLLAVTVPPMLAVASLQTWSGGWCWGPRVWLFATPVLLLPLSRWLHGVLERPHSRTRALQLVLVATVASAGGVVQLLGNSFYWDHHVRLAKHVQERWLGKPDRRGAILQPIERRACDPCVEDMHGVLWLPALQPIAGHAWFVRHVALDSDPEVALLDAPWRRYTSLEMDVSRELHGARVDWWGMLWLDRFPERRGVGIGLLLAFAGIAGAGMVLTGRSLRRDR